MKFNLISQKHYSQSSWEMCNNLYCKRLLLAYIQQTCARTCDTFKFGWFPHSWPQIGTRYDIHNKLLSNADHPRPMWVTESVSLCTVHMSTRGWCWLCRETFGYISPNWRDAPSLDAKYIRKRAMQVQVSLQCGTSTRLSLDLLIVMFPLILCHICRFLLAFLFV